MRVLMLPRYGLLGASSRQRMYQYLPALEAAGCEVTVSPLFGDGYVRALYARRRAFGEVLAGYARRLRSQLTGGSYDVVWVEKELLPWWPAFAERVRGRHALVVDYDDAVFHRYDRHRSALVRRLLGARIDKVMRRADMVTAGNGYLAERALAAGCRNVQRLPTVVDLARYPKPLRNTNPARRVTIGWIGSPSTADYLRPLAPVIAQLVAESGVEAIAIGAREDQIAGTPFRAVSWSEASEVELVSGFDIGIMPLPDAPWERGKCGYKLIQYMACGLPVVASPVGVNTEIVTEGENGLLAMEPAQWLQALRKLVADAPLRKAMGASGRARVEQWYSLQAQAPRLIAMLQDAARRGRNH